MSLNIMLRSILDCDEYQLDATTTTSFELFYSPLLNLLQEVCTVVFRCDLFDARIHTKDAGHVVFKHKK